MNVYYIPDFLRWKLEQNFKKINKWPLAAGGINFHFVYHPPHLNVKVLPAQFKQQVREKFEEFYKWWEANWELGLTEEQKGKVTFEQWRSSEYGIKRLEGIVQFMESEDWSNRLPETKEYLELIDKQRNLKFEEVFYEMKGIFDENK